MSTKRYLTKSRFKLAVDCPTKLFYVRKDVYDNTMEENAFMAMLADGGFQVGALAKFLYPDGIEIHEKGNQKALELTKPHLAKENVVLFEPAIQYGNFLIRIDILVKQGNHFDLIEVKAKSYDSRDSDFRGKRGEINSGMKPYLQDVAFQKWVLQQAFPTTTIRTFLLMPDKAKKAPIDGINQMFKIEPDRSVTPRVPENIDLSPIAQSLLYKVAVDEYTEEILSSPIKFPGGELPFEEACKKWSDAYAADQKITPVIGAHCGQCEFRNSENFSRSGFHECWKQANNWGDEEFKDGTVLDLWNSRSKQKFIENGRLKLSNLTKSDILKDSDNEEAGINGLTRGQRQALQLDDIPADYDCGGLYFDKGYFQVAMSKWKYPYHMIDFETSSVALPFYEGMSAYEAVAFQYSHHVLREDGSVEHIGEFLCTEPGKFPNYEFARALKKELEQDDGTVFMWSHHENTILSTILRQLGQDPAPPEDAQVIMDFIKTIIKGAQREMVDLCFIAEKSFYHKSTKGSNSIKHVLPAILEVSEKLRKLYSQPVYGKSDGIISKNFKGIAWLDSNGFGSPYIMLKKYAADLLPDGVKETEEGETSVIGDGGAATTAYSRLQFEDLNLASRIRIEEAMLRYCELDTLAMVMVMQGWQGFLKKEQ